MCTFDGVCSQSFAGNTIHMTWLMDTCLERREEGQSLSTAAVFRGIIKTETNITSTQYHVRFMILFDIFL